MHRLLSFILGTTIVILLFSTYFHSITAITQDLGRHILLGEIILKTQSIPHVNLFSYTYPDFPFINHHWLSEVMFYLTYSVVGFTGILFLTAFCFIMSFLLLIFTAWRKGNTLAISLVSFLSLGILFERTDVRPEAFSMLFFSVFLLLLFRNRAKPTKLIYLLIPLQILWTNTHVYFAVGILLIGLFFLDTLIVYRKQLFLFMKTKKHFPKELFSLGATLFCTSLVTLCNPNGLAGALYPLRVFDNYGYAIEENQNLFFLWNYYPKRTIAFFGITVILLFITLFIRLKYTRPIDWLLAIVFTVLGIQAERNVSLFVYAVFLPFVSYFSVFFTSLVKDKYTYIVGFSLTGLLLWQLHFVLTTKPLDISTPNGAQQGAEFVLAKHVKGPFFNNFDIGSYFLFRLFPKEKVFVDGRPEAYPALFFQNVYIPMQQSPPVFEKIDQQYKFNAIFFAHTDQTPWANQFLKDIVTNPSWKTIYLDHTVLILVKNTSTNNYLPSLNIDTVHPSASTLQELYQLFLFFQKTERPNQQIAIAKRIIEKNPYDCFALSVLATYYAQTQSPMISVYGTRFDQSCR